MRSSLFIRVALLLCCLLPSLGFAADQPRVVVHRCDDFIVNGTGDHAAWEKSEWIELQRRSNGKLEYQARVKMMYSEKGLYLLFDGTDEVLSATLQEDFADLWNEDVYECFVWPDETQTIYFEYEISPLGYELPILVPNLNGRFLGWRPWHYEGERKIQKAISTRGGDAKSKGIVRGWSAEVFIPYDLLRPLGNVPPKPGSKWRANFYRVDYDYGRTTAWDWSRVGPSFHDFERFGTLEFE